MGIVQKYQNDYFNKILEVNSNFPCEINRIKRDKHILPIL